MFGCGRIHVGAGGDDGGELLFLRLHHRAVHAGGRACSRSSGAPTARPSAAAGPALPHHDPRRAARSEPAANLVAGTQGADRHAKRALQRLGVPGDRGMPALLPFRARRWTVGALAGFHATAKGQRGRIAGPDPWLAGPLQQPGRPLGHSSGAAPANPSATSRPNNTPIVSPWVHSTASWSPRSQNSVTTSPGPASTPSAATSSIPSRRSRASGWTVWWPRRVGLHKIRSTGKSSKRTTSPSAWRRPTGDSGRSLSGPSQPPLVPASAWRTTNSTSHLSS